MRLLFYDIKSNLFLLRTYDNIIRGINIKTNKDGNILRVALEENNIQVLNYSPKKKRIREKGMDLITYNNNKIDYKKIHDIYDLSEIQKDDIYIAWYYMASHMDLLSQLCCKKVVMGQHFIKLSYNTNFTDMGVDAFVNQINIADNDFIKYFFKLENVKCISVPYIWQNRFVNKKSFFNRKKKAMSIGTISTVNGKGYDVYLEYMRKACVQPMRKEIYENGDNDFIDVYNHYLFTTGYNNGINCHTKFFDYIKARINDWREAGERAYYSFDIVEKYNEYMMCICGEEIVGLPGCGFVECMACGCAYIGLDHKMYRGLGLVPGKHYIAYDGTYSDLLVKIEYFQNNLDALYEIARCGEEFIAANFSEKQVISSFFKKIESLEEK